MTDEIHRGTSGGPGWGAVLDNPYDLVAFPGAARGQRAVVGGLALAGSLSVLTGSVLLGRELVSPQAAHAAESSEGADRTDGSTIVDLPPLLLGDAATTSGTPASPTLFGTDGAAPGTDDTDDTDGFLEDVVAPEPTTGTARTAVAALEVADIGSMSIPPQADDDGPPIEIDVITPPDLATLPVGPAPVRIGPDPGGSAPAPSASGASTPGSPGSDLGLDDLLEIAGAGIPPRSASLPVRCAVPNVGPSASPEAAMQSAKELCDDQIKTVANDAARDLAVDANLAAQEASRSERYQGVFTCDVPVRAAWTRSPVLPFLYFASATGRGTCILNAVPR